MAASLGVDTGRVYAVVFTLGTALGGIGGALVVPSAAATPEMAVELVVEAFAVVVIGGLGSMAGALAGAAIVGVLRAVALLSGRSWNCWRSMRWWWRCCSCARPGCSGSRAT